MRSLNRFLSAIMAVIMVFSSITIFNVYAAETILTVNIENTAKIGDNVTCKINLSGNTGWGALGFNVYYNKDVLEYVAETKGNALAAASTSINDNSGYVTVIAYTDGDNITENGNILDIEFNAIAVGSSDVYIELSDYYDIELNTVECEVVNAVINVEDDKTTTSTSITTTETSTETTTATTTETTTETTTIYTIRFRSNGGTECDPINATGGQPIELPSPTRDGYVFKGWFTDYSYENEFKSTDIVESNLTLYAKWNRLVTISFDTNGGTAVDDIKAEEGSKINLPTTSKSGCSFEGWYQDSLWSDEFNSNTDVPSYNRTLYAKFIKSKPTQTEIKAKYNALNLSSVTNKFDVTPNTSAPYKTGVLNNNFTKTGLDYVNFVRYICGLQDVEIDSSATDLAQHGAVLLAQEYSHTPSKPSDMDEEFYEIGYDATSSSNIAWNYSTVSNLSSFVELWMNDADSSNMSVVGHRRWLLNPYMKKTAFGYAEKSSSYANVLAFDESNDDVDYYDYISYPSNGYFPKNIIDNTVPWSVSLNTALYKIDSINDINVSITNKTSGRVYNLSQADYRTNPNTNTSYLNYNKGGYGISSCLIFNIGANNISNAELNGEFDVKITGLKDNNGNDTSIEYTINFFDLNESSSSNNSSANNSSSGSKTSSNSSSGSSGGGGGGGGGGGNVTSTYTVKFDTNGGNSISSVSVKRNSTLSEPTDPVRSGYTFTGWYTDKACTKEFDFDTKVTKAFTLFAGWTKGTVTKTTETTKVTETKTETTTVEQAYNGNVEISIGSRNIKINGNSYNIDVAPYIQTSSNSTLVPLRFVALALGNGNVNNADASKNIEWDAETKTATVYYNNKIIKFTAGSNIIVVNGVERMMDYGVTAEITDSRMFIPFRALGNALGVSVEWDAETKTAIYKK